MPIVPNQRGFTISSGFRYEASFRLEHPDLDPAAISAALAMTPDASRAGDGGGAPCLWIRSLPAEPDLPAALRRFTDRLSAAREFLARVRDGGGRYSYLALVLVDYNAMTELGADLLLRLAELRIDLTVHALAAEGAETLASIRALRGQGLPF